MHFKSASMQKLITASGSSSCSFCRADEEREIPARNVQPTFSGPQEIQVKRECCTEHFGLVLFPLGSHGPSVLQLSSRLIGNRDARNAADAAEGFSGGRPNLHPHTFDTHPFAGAQQEGRNHGSLSVSSSIRQPHCKL